jgi:post-segregation antitoxin (ccd killing protein)
MARMQVYLPDDLYKLVKSRGLPASELLQKAVRAELRRQELLAETDRYVADLVAEVGPPSAAQRTRASAVARRLARRPTRQVG